MAYRIKSKRRYSNHSSLPNQQAKEPVITRELSRLRPTDIALFSEGHERGERSALPNELVGLTVHEESLTQKGPGTGLTAKRRGGVLDLRRTQNELS